jgi:hypothetical protein
MYAADELASVLARLDCPDWIQDDIEHLRQDLLQQLRSGTPWKARARMDVLASLDAIAWTGLLGLIDECPVRHAAISAASHATQVSATAFGFIADEAALAEIRMFLRDLPALLS